MAAFRIYLATLFAIIAIYTALVVADHGWGLLPIFFGDIAKMGWPGQFNLDFLGMLSLSALWTAWRNRFSGAGLLLALLAFNLGAPFLCLYLLLLTGQAKGDMAIVLLGPDRAAGKAGRWNAQAAAQRATVNFASGQDDAVQNSCSGKLIVPLPG